MTVREVTAVGSEPGPDDSGEFVTAGQLADSEELERYHERQEMFTCGECGEVADVRQTVPTEHGSVTTLWKRWVAVHTEDAGDGRTVYYFHIAEDEVDRGAELRELLAPGCEDVEVEPDPREDPRKDDRPDLDEFHRAAERQGRNPHTGKPRTDGGEPDTGVPATLRDDAHADVYDSERCDGAGSDPCVREDPELTRGEDEIHVTTFGPGHDKSGRRVLCGDCKWKQTALNIADDPELAVMYQDELPDLRERFPDILGDVDLPVTDGGTYRYEVGVRAFTHEQVRAKSAERAKEKALEQADIPAGWEVDGATPSRLTADGGVESQPDAAREWEQKAHENVQRWGVQPVDGLLLAMGEELGELAAEIHGFADYPEPEDSDGARMAEHGRDLIRRMDHLGRDIRDYLETVSERDGEPVPPEDRPDYLDPFPPDLKRSRRERLIRAELDDLMALGFQTLWALEQPHGGEGDE